MIQLWVLIMAKCYIRITGGVLYLQETTLEGKIYEFFGLVLNFVFHMAYANVRFGNY